MSLPTSDPPKQFLDLAHGRVAYTDEGDTSLAGVVMLHGAPGSGRDFRYLAPPIAGRGLRVIRIDFPGFGDSPRHGPDDIDEHVRARVAIELIQALELERIIVLGHSLGGMVTSAVATQMPKRVVGLGFLNAVGPGAHKMSMRRTPIISAILHWLFTRPDNLAFATRPVIRGMFRAGGFSSRLKYDEMELAFRCGQHAVFEAHTARLHQLQVPVLTAWAEDDPLIESEIFEQLDTVCPPGPRMRFSNGGHNVQKGHAQEIGEALVHWAKPLLDPAN